MSKEEILIRVLSPSTQKVKHVFASVANNKQLMKNVGFVISDPNYEEKMECIKNKKPFIDPAKRKEQEKIVEKVVESVIPEITAPIETPKKRGRKPKTETQTQPT